MAIFENWMNRRKGKQTTGDLFKLDTKNKTPEQNIVEIIQGLYIKKQTQNEVSPTNKTAPHDGRTITMSRALMNSGSDGRRLSYLNALVTLISKEERDSLGFTPEELMTCLRISLVDDSVVIRAAALRVLRYLIKTESDVASFNTLKLHYLVIRSMDLMLRNEEERAQALRVVRRVVAVIGPSTTRRHRSACIEPGLLRCLVAISRTGNAGDGTGDRLARPAVATLAEIGVMSPSLAVHVGALGAISRFACECATPRMSEALCGALLHALDQPAARRAARLDLRQLCAPYCDFHVRPHTTDSIRDEREIRFTCSRLSLLCVLRSWPGLLHFCHPYSAGGLRALVHALRLPRLEVRKAILDLLYELLGLPQPEWTDEISVALGAVDPSDFQDLWRLNEGFVAAEGVAILPHLCATGPDITEIHLALLLQCFLEAGLLDGLAEVIVTSDTFISVRATVLMGQLLHLIHTLLPPQICNITPALPTLIAQASAGKPQALAAIAALKMLHTMLEARPATNSLFLDHIIQYCSGAFKEKVEDTSKSRKEKDNAIMASPKLQNVPLYKDSSIEFLNESDNEEPKQRHSVGSRAEVTSRNVSALVKSKSVSSRTSAAVSKVTKSSKFFNLFERESDSLLRASLVMQNKDGNAWNWDIIRTILKEHDSPLINVSDSAHRAWVWRIINYLRPSSNKYSHADLTASCHHSTRAACQLVRILLRNHHMDSERMLESLFEDVSRQIAAIETGRKAHECLFSPQHMCTTMCQMYFLLAGQLCHSHNGLKLFKQTQLFDNLLELSTKTHHSCYVKLVISSLDYTIDSYPREILAKTLTCSIQASRLYATQFLNVLLRASQKSRDLLRKKMKVNKSTLQEAKSLDGENLNMDTWILQMLIGQIKDESKAVVKCAITILEEACSVPAYLDKLVSMKQLVALNCRFDKSSEPSSLDMSVAGDRGYLLWLSLEVAALAHNSDQINMGFVRKHLEFWTRSYNYRYVGVVESMIHGALTLGGAAGEGAGGGGGGRRSAVLPAHILGSVVKHPAAAPSLLHHVLPHHYMILKQSRCSNEREVMDLKATLWALGNASSTNHGIQLVMQQSSGSMEDSIPVLVVRLAKYCPVYSVRAAAFYVLGLIGSTYVGANLLQELGWLCVRHTRHEQFPIIQEGSTPTATTGNLHHLITSPNRRYVPRVYDVEISEHSDHTDQSTAESVHSDQMKGSKSIIANIEHHTHKKDRDTVDAKTRFDYHNEKRKSYTLPSQGYSIQQTLAESRTVDILRDFSNYERSGLHIGLENRLLIGRMNSLDAHEGRVRNTSESSTSGVSSCDSVLGRYGFPDRVPTLSPIPSSSSLYGMKSGSQRSRLSESQRRTSVSSFTAPDTSSSPPSQRDMAGYATLKSLNRSRRPHLSESAASGQTDIDDLSSWILSESTRRSKPFSSLRDRGKSSRERMAKISLLALDWKPMQLESTAAPRQSSPPRPAPAPRPRHLYRGLCLPANIHDLFPRGEGDDNTLDVFAGDTSFLLDASAAVESKHNTSTDNNSFVVKGTGVSWQCWRHSAAACLVCVRTRPPSAHELREAFFAGMESPKQSSSIETEVVEPSTPQSMLLQYAHNMANPIHHKQTRPALIALKQSNPEVFHSACVYSDVCSLLSTGTYMMGARRFLQELFLDVSFECFLQEPKELLARRLPASSSQSLSIAE